MRIVPIITALLVTAGLFLLVMKRDVVIAFATGNTEETTKVEAEQTTTPTSEPASVVRVVVQRSQSREIDSAVILRGETEAARQVEVRSETTSRVISEPLRKGSFVQKDQELCKLDPGTRPAALANAQAQLANAKAQVPQAEARIKEAQARFDEAQINDTVASELSKEGYASNTRVASTQAGVKSAEASIESARSGVESAQAGIRAAEANVEVAETEIERLTITAPFAGLLETDTAELGSLLTAGSVCATVIQLDPIKVIGYVPETQVNRVSLGSLAGARLSDGQEVRGRVIFLSRSADPQTRTFRVDIEVTNEDLSIRDGQTAEILIASAGTRAHLLPQSSLTLDDGGRLGVRIVEDDNVVAFKPVSLIRDTAEGTWVSGLPETVDVIVVGQEYVVDGVKVLPTYREVSQ
ncbi:Multidrug transporter MdtA [Thalassovita gelatinovora]|uniref:Multidrug transporter MdtA n=1 Tax=Thalassovita gelatinovora TaxID=53501 RepID=A0A0P1F3S8_THAGE|nr:efflux RND transporter periplasmic adaptor subunit [Thalassovita gelatinovora]QIZ79227.1 efflux RND transporter periplasmic adaptor subunit [Thalassovita gelatinovora]CUH62390.1 Multidrug transporter MdtA [Thalassovita gelatinovora]SER18366.1 membrane fusion protein, multidrug efflux system [Thalassovita gelatinovora]